MTKSKAGAKPATATKLSSVALGKVRLSQVEFSKGGQRGETEGGAIPPIATNWSKVYCGQDVQGLAWRSGAKGGGEERPKVERYHPPPRNRANTGEAQLGIVV